MSDQPDNQTAAAAEDMQRKALEWRLNNLGCDLHKGNGDELLICKNWADISVAAFALAETEELRHLLELASSPNKAVTEALELAENWKCQAEELRREKDKWRDIAAQNASAALNLMRMHSEAAEQRVRELESADIQRAKDISRLTVERDEARQAAQGQMRAEEPKEPECHGCDVMGTIVGCPRHDPKTRSLYSFWKGSEDEMWHETHNMDGKVKLTSPMTAQGCESEGQGLEDFPERTPAQEVDAIRRRLAHESGKAEGQGEAAQVQGWVSVKERLPHTHTVLGYIVGRPAHPAFVGGQPFIDTVTYFPKHDPQRVYTDRDHLIPEDGEWRINGDEEDSDDRGVVIVTHWRSLPSPHPNETEFPANVQPSTPAPLEGQDDPQWLVWSHEHGLWWRANKGGYTNDIAQAGRYTLKDALSCCDLRSAHKDGTPNEIVSPSPEWLAAHSGDGKEREPRCDKCDSREFITAGGTKLQCRNCWNVDRVTELEKQLALAEQRHDYHPEYVEAVEKVGKLEAELAALKGERGQMHIDIGNLISELEAHQQNTGEYLEADDAAIVADIAKRHGSWPVTPTSSDPSQADERDIHGLTDLRREGRGRQVLQALEPIDYAKWSREWFDYRRLSPHDFYLPDMLLDFHAALEQEPSPEPEGQREAAQVGRDVRQREVSEWCAAAFGADHASSVPQRGIRMLEEAIEAYQSATMGLPLNEMRDKAHLLVDYVFGRVSGNLAQECGGVGLTLLALCEAAGISAESEELREIARVKSKPLEHFNKRNQAKNEAGFELPSPPGTHLHPKQVDNGRFCEHGVCCELCRQALHPKQGAEQEER